MTAPQKDTGFEAQPYWGICTFGRQSHTRDLTGVDVAIVGVPYDGSTSYRSGARFVPRAIRVSESAPRSIVHAAPNSTSSSTTSRPTCGNAS